MLTWHQSVAWELAELFLEELASVQRNVQGSWSKTIDLWVGFWADIKTGHAWWKNISSAHGCMASHKPTIGPGRKKGEPFMVSNWEPSPGKCTAVMCSDSCDISSCAEVSETPGNRAKMLLHLIWLSLLVDPWSALTKGVLQLKQRKPKPKCITNTRVYTRKQITQLAQGLTHSLPTSRAEHTDCNTQPSDQWPSPMQAVSKRHFGAWTVCSAFSCLPKTKGQQSDHYSKCCFLRSL